MGAYEYTPYGEVYAESGDTTITHRYAMLEWDGAAQQYFAPYRYYMPGAVRWMQREPMGFDAGPNLYAYCWAAPQTWVDSDGALPQIVILTAIGAGTGALACGLTQAFAEGVPLENLDWGRIAKGAAMGAVQGASISLGTSAGSAFSKWAFGEKVIRGGKTYLRVPRLLHKATVAEGAFIGGIAGGVITEHAVPAAPGVAGGIGSWLGGAIGIGASLVSDLIGGC